MEYKHKLQRTREKLRLGRAEPQRAREKRRLAQKKLRLVREGPQRSPCMVPNEWRLFVHFSTTGGF